MLTNEKELSDALAKIDQYEWERHSLQVLVEEEQRKVLNLERQREETTLEMNQLKEKISTLSTLASVCIIDNRGRGKGCG